MKDLNNYITEALKNGLGDISKDDISTALSETKQDGIYVVYHDHLSCDAFWIFLIKDGVCEKFVEADMEKGYNEAIEKLKKSNNLKVFYCNIAWYTFPRKWKEIDPEKEKKYYKFDEGFDLLSLIDNIKESLEYNVKGNLKYNKDKDLIIESVEHVDKGDKGEFKSEDSYLVYTTDVETYPEPTEDAIEINDLYVDKRRMGIGTALVNKCIEFAKKKNISNIVVYAEPIGDKISEDDLLKFYSKLGFVQDKRVCLTDYYRT